MGRDFVLFVWFCLFNTFTMSRTMLVHGRCLINIWGMSEFLYMSPGAHVQEFSRAVVFKVWSRDSWGPWDPFRGVCEGKSVFIRILRHYLSSSLSFFTFKCFPDIWWHHHSDSLSSVYLYIFVLKMPVLISNMVNFDNYNPHEQQLFEVLNNF